MCYDKTVKVFLGKFVDQTHELQPVGELDVARTDIENRESSDFSDVIKLRQSRHNCMNVGIRDAVARHLRCICTAADDGASGSDDGDFRFFHSGLVCPKNRARKGSPSRAGESFLPHKDGKKNNCNNHRQEGSLCNVKRIGLSQAGNKNGDAGNRGSRAAGSAC